MSEPQTTSPDVQTHTSPDSSDEKTHPRFGNPKLNHPDVESVTASDFTGTEAIVSALDWQETRSPLDESNCCNSGDKGFRTYKTDLPLIELDDLEPGMLIYRPTTSPLTVYEINSEPYWNEFGSHRIDVIAHSRDHAGDGADVKTREQSLFIVSVVDEMTFLQPETVQETLTGN